jgi:hypothetical protein
MTIAASANKLMEKQTTGTIYLVAAAATAVLILILSFVLPKDSEVAVFLLDHSTKSFFAKIYPFTIQNVMYLMTAVGFADLYVRYAATLREERYLTLNLLPERRRRQFPMSHSLPATSCRPHSDPTTPTN